MTLISVVIPTKDSERHIGACLDSLERQTFRDFETIVVDGGSRDSTCGLVTGRARLLRSGSSLPQARNEGFAEAEGSIFVSIDSDMVLEETLLAEISSSMGANGALVLPEAGAGRGVMPGLKALEKECYLGDDAIESARAFTRAAFESVGGYDGSLLFGEDRDLHLRLSRKYRIGRTEAKVLHDTTGLTFLGDMRKSFRYGKSLSRYASKNPSDTRSWLSLRNLFVLRYRRTLIGHPFAAVGLMALKACECASGAMGYARGRLQG